MTKYHLYQSITGPSSEWKKALKWITKSDGSTYESVEELKSAFVSELSKGHEVVPIGDCDNFDWKSGCKGHPV